MKSHTAPKVTRIMAFTRALFYPWIDISNEAWLKSTMLYWDCIQTIVPTSVRWPYRSETARAFHDAGMLTPFGVEPGMEEVESLSDDVSTYLDTPEGLNMLAERALRRAVPLHRDKLSPAIRDLVDIHRQKFSEAVFQQLAADADTKRRNAFVEVPDQFAAFYMTLLANRICERHGLGPLTYDPAADRLTTVAKLNGASAPRQPFWHEPPDGRYYRNRDIPRSFAQALAATVVLEKLRLDPGTPVDEIIRFREAHKDELGRFRTLIGEMVDTTGRPRPLGALRQEVEDLYANEIRPAYNDLKSALKSSKIRYITENTLKIWGVSVPATSIAVSLMNMSVPVAVAATTGLSVVAGMVWFDRQKQDLLRNSPYTYLFSLERRFSWSGRAPFS